MWVQTHLGNGGVIAWLRLTPMGVCLRENSYLEMRSLDKKLTTGQRQVREKTAASRPHKSPIMWMTGSVGVPDAYWNHFSQCVCTMRVQSHWDNRVIAWPMKGSDPRAMLASLEECQTLHASTLQAGSITKKRERMCMRDNVHDAHHQRPTLGVPVRPKPGMCMAAHEAALETWSMMCAAQWRRKRVCTCGSGVENAMQERPSRPPDRD